MSEISSATSALRQDYATQYSQKSSSVVENTTKVEEDKEKTEKLAVSSSDMAKAAVSTVNTQSDSEIISEIKRNGLAATKNVQQIAQDYHISVTRAQKILDKIKNNGSNKEEEETNTEEHTVEPEMSNSYSYSVESTPNLETSTVEYNV